VNRDVISLQDGGQRDHFCAAKKNLDLSPFLRHESARSFGMMV
jgi:hypothetical protein